MPPAVGQSRGKEEIRAGLVKPYLLRYRHEKGEEAYATLLGRAGLQAPDVDSERAWLSERDARRLLVLLVEAYGTRGVLRERGTWATHPEALGMWMRMLRSAKKPRDAYEYLAANVRELTRMGIFETEPRGGAGISVTYRRRDDEETGGSLRPEYESLFCAARVGELTGFPRIWGLPGGVLEHPTCLAKGGDRCIYHVSWEPSRPKLPLATAVVLACSAVGAAAGTLGLASAPATFLGMAAGLGLGLGLVYLLEIVRQAQRRTAFEANRIAALERGLELKGELGTAPGGELLGAVLGGKYRIDGKLGSGGIGVVYAATHVGLGHEVAVKVLRGAAAKDGSEIARLRREAYIQTHVENRNVVRVLDLDQMPDGSIYVVMERLHGRTLADKMAKDGLVGPGLALHVLTEVCRGLAAVHDKDVVHRDLKPGNIFLCADGSAKVLDFGMSKLASAEALTQEGYTLGTPEYMAPEQCIGAAVEPRTDLYSLGVVLYEAMTAQLPISSPNRRDLLDLHQRKVPQSMRALRPDLPIPIELDRLVMQCLEKKIPDRPASAATLAEQLAAIPMNHVPFEYPPGMPRRALDAMSMPPPPETVSSLPLAAQQEEKSQEAGHEHEGGRRHDRPIGPA